MTQSGPLLYIVTGEPSGDQLAARLMAALRARTGGRIRFAGIGGEAMQAQGLESLFPMADLAVMGLLEVVPSIPRILGRLKQTIADIEAKRPDAVLTVDSWGFTGRVAKALKARGVGPRLHYVAPMVWAWKEKRVHQLAERLDLLLCLLPNEPAYFEQAGLRAVHVGHAVIESGADRGDGPAFRARHGIDAAAPLLCVLPGSRRSETGRLLPVFRDTVARLAQTHAGLRVVVPTVDTVAAPVAAEVAGWAAPTVVVRGPQEKYGAFAAADVALAASGTVALELALAGLPTVVTYKVSAVSAWLARRLLKIKYVNLVNLTLGEMAVPELLQDQCAAQPLAAAVTALLSDPAARATQAAQAREAMRRLGWGVDQPSERAAEAILAAMNARL